MFVFLQETHVTSLTIESPLTTVIVKRLSKINILLIFIYLIVLFYKSVTWTLNWIKREVASWSEFVPVTKSEKEDHFEVHPIRERLIQKLFYKLFFSKHHKNCLNCPCDGVMVKMEFLQEIWPFKMWLFFCWVETNIFNPFYNERVMCIRLRVAPTDIEKASAINSKHFSQWKTKIYSWLPFLTLKMTFSPLFL